MNREGVESLYGFSIFISSIVMGTYLARGLARLSNTDYSTFINKYYELKTKTKDNIAQRKKFMINYDFDLKDWDADFNALARSPPFENEKHKWFHDTLFDSLKGLFFKVLTPLCMDTFAIRMAFPGVILQSLIGKALLDGRTKFIEQKNAQRAVVLSGGKFKNKVDTLFIDKRNVVNYSSFGDLNGQSNGKYLVICCDGNASFYEVGIFQLPIENGYSTLGWNYPGFGHSSGSPYPDQLTESADAVMQYGISLGFSTDNIILFSWSIGGFAASYLSNHYPDVRAVIMDACFDNISPLAIQQMPKFACEFVDYCCRHRLNLNISQIISRYNGPLVFIRRTSDEIISTT
jgi:hypothetical protein